VAPAILPTVGVPGVPPTAVFEFHPTLGLSEEYSDNFFRTSRGKQENWRTTLSAGFNLLINGAFTKGLIATSLSGAYDTATGSEEYSFFPSVTGQVSWQATPRLTLTATDVLTRNDNPAQADRLGLRQQRNTFTSNIFSLASDYLLGHVGTRQYYRISTFFDEAGGDTITHTVGASASRTFYETNTATLGYEYLDSNTSGSTTSQDETTRGHQVTGSLSRQFTTFTTGGVSTAYGTRRITGSSAPANDYQTWNVALFAGYALPGKWSINGNVGVSHLMPDSGSDRTLVSTSSTLSYSLARTTATLGVDQGFSETFGLGEDFGVVETRGVTASLTHLFTPSFTGTASAYYRENKSTGAGGSQATLNQANEDETNWGGSIVFTIRLLRWLTLGLEYAYTDVNASRDRSYTENRGRASLNAGF
jgi:hypothetical protein